MHDVMLKSGSMATKCGINAINRPCQSLARGNDMGLPVPRHPICHSPNEKIYIVDGDTNFLKEASEMLAWIGTPVACFDNPFEFQKAAPPMIVGCVILDVRIPQFDGPSLHNWLRSVHCIAPTVFLSATADVTTAVECMLLGAHNFLLKPAKEAELSSTVISAISRSRMRFCEISNSGKIEEVLSRLTPTERKVANLIARGYLTKQIAAMMERSENTVKIHRYRIMNKVGASSSAALVRMITMLNEKNKPSSEINML
jgi:FixJ family two-component response regulator